MDKIKIMRIVTRLNIGGPAVHTILLTKEINGGEFDSVLISGSVSKKEGDMSYMAEGYNVRPVYVSSMSREINPIADIKAFLGILRYMKEYKPDIVHTHTAKAGTLGRLAAMLTKVPVRVHTFHGHVFSGYFNNLVTKFFIFAERLLANCTDCIIAISDCQKDEIVKRYKITGEEKCRMMKLGFDLEGFLSCEKKKGTFRKRFNFASDDLLVGIVGRLTAIKNHRMFIDMAEYVNAHAPKEMSNKIKFIIIGDGELREPLVKEASKKGLSKKIFFTGWIEKMPDVYADMDMVVLTSINEGTPVSLIEAMASSRPIISTDVGGVRDAVGECAILVASDDYIAMGEKVLELSRFSSKRDDLGRRGRERAKFMYSKERLANELKELYKYLLSKNRKGRT